DPHADDLYNPGADPYTFTVVYSGAVPVRMASLDDGDLLVTGPNGFSRPAHLVSVSDPSDGTDRVATYSVDAPAGGWTAADRGRYTISLDPNEVSDVAGATLAGGVLAAFQVRAAASGPLAADADTTLLLGLDGSLVGDAGETLTGGAGATFVPG